MTTSPMAPLSTEATSSSSSASANGALPTATTSLNKDKKEKPASMTSAAAATTTAVSVTTGNARRRRRQRGRPSPASNAEVGNSNGSDDGPSPLHPEGDMNLSLLDPPRYGWSARGGVVDLLPPHERARRRSAQDSYLTRRKRLDDLAAEERRRREDEKKKEKEEEERERQRVEREKAKKAADAIAEEARKAQAEKEKAAAAAAADAITSGGLTPAPPVPSGILNSTRSPRAASEGVRKAVAALQRQPSLKDEEAKAAAADAKKSSESVAALPAPPKSAAVATVGVAAPTAPGVNADGSAATMAPGGVDDVASKSQVDEATKSLGDGATSAEGEKKDGDCDDVDEKKEDEKKDKTRVLRPPRALLPSPSPSGSDHGGDGSGPPKLDVHSYHRGIAGLEPRDRKTGELLCDVEPGDINHDWDGPPVKMLVAKVKIVFPLGDMEDNEDNEEDGGERKEGGAAKGGDDGRDGGGEKKRPARARRMGSRSDSAVSEASVGTRSSKSAKSGGDAGAADLLCDQYGPTAILFRDEINWDILDPETPTPYAFATTIASEYGLTLGQTIDLSTSIQGQLDEYVAKSTSYDRPITWKDPHGTQRNVEDFHRTVPHSGLPLRLHGGAFPPIQVNFKATQQAGGGSAGGGGAGGGMRPPRFGPGSGRWPPGGRGDKASKSSGGGGRNYRSKLTNATPVPAHLLPTHADLAAAGTGSVEDKYRDEVLRRAKAEAASAICKRASRIEFGKNLVCHICHHRKDNCAVFACGMHGHIYCDSHCAARLGFSAKDAWAKERAGEHCGVTYDNCPVCSLSCLCAKCRRKLDSVSRAFKGRCVTKGVDGGDGNDFSAVDMEILPIATGRVSLPPPGPSAAALSVAARRETVKPKEKNESKARGADGSQADARDKPGDPAATGRGARGLRRRGGDHEAPPTPKRRRLDRHHQGSVGKHHHRAGGSAGAPDGRRRYTRVPASHFPKEVCSGEVLDAAAPDDYRTVFSAAGALVRRDLPDRPRDGGGADDKGALDPPPPRSDGAAASTVAAANADDLDDGSVDFCRECNRGGQLVCCDRCPRSFHQRCLPDPAAAEGDGEFVCHCCVRDGSDPPPEEDEVSGEGSMNAIAAATARFGHCAGFELKLSALARIHEILLFLQRWDFGCEFAEALDWDNIPGYREVVSHPMDMGTICKNIINERYVNAAIDDIEAEEAAAAAASGDVDAMETTEFEVDLEEPRESAKVLDEVIFSALRDLEYVWHNCLLYNPPKSVFAKMAAVQSNKCRRMLERSVRNILSDGVRRRIDDFVLERKIEKDRKAVGRKAAAAAEADADAGPVVHRITVPHHGSKLSRSVAVLHPRLGTLSMVYSSVASACRAAIFLSKRGYVSEFGSVSETRVKQMIQRSGQDPALVLFGRRWLYLDDLRAGRVTFPQQATPSQEVLSSGGGRSPAVPGLEDEGTYFVLRDTPDGKRSIYASVDVAFSYGKEGTDAAPLDAGAVKAVGSGEGGWVKVEGKGADAGMNTAMALEHFRERLQSVPYDVPVDALGSTWRKVSRPSGGGTPARATPMPPARRLVSFDGNEGNLSSEYSEDDEGDDDGGIFTAEGLSPAMPSAVTIVKEDLVSGACLGGFETMESAYRDWRRSRRDAIGILRDPTDRDVFEKYYVNGRRNVDGMVWKMAEGKISSAGWPEAAGNGGADEGKNKGISTLQDQTAPTEDSVLSRKISESDVVTSIPNNGTSTLLVSSGSTKGPTATSVEMAERPQPKDASTEPSGLGAKENISSHLLAPAATTATTTAKEPAIGVDPLPFPEAQRLKEGVSSLTPAMQIE